jgi:hypothetical protein
MVTAATFAACQPTSSAHPQGPGQVDVSNHPLPQDEVNIAADPTNPRVLLAASNSFQEGTLRVYGSTDGGRSWTSDLAPLPRAASIGAADPWVGIDLSGRQYLAEIAIPGLSASGRLYVLSRIGSKATWTVPSLPVDPLGDPSQDFDDKDTLIVDVAPRSPHVNRVYVAWSRNKQIMIAHSDDQAATWSKPAVLTEPGGSALGANLGLSSSGDVYASWASNAGLTIERSTDGGDHWSQPTNFGSTGGKACPRIPATPTACANEFPEVAVDRSTGKYAGRVYAVFAIRTPDDRVGVFVNAFNGDLTDVAGSPWRVDRPIDGAGADRFYPVVAVNQQSGVVWACFYDTAPDPRPIKTYFSCTLSRDGGVNWASPVHAATTASDETSWRAFTNTAQSAGRVYGDYEGLAVADGVAHPIWTDGRDLARLQEEIYTATLTEADFSSN